MLTLLRLANVILIVAMVGCIAGALAGLIVLLPFVAGAWSLNLAALITLEEKARPGWIERLHAGPSPPAASAGAAHPAASAELNEPAQTIEMLDRAHRGLTVG